MMVHGRRTSAQTQSALFCPVCSRRPPHGYPLHGVTQPSQPAHYLLCRIDRPRPTRLSEAPEWALQKSGSRSRSLDLRPAKAPFRRRLPQRCAPCVHSQSARPCRARPALATSTAIHYTPCAAITNSLNKSNASGYLPARASGCHWTPTMNRLPTFSIASTIPSPARAATSKPGAAGCTAW